jgi:hypothetical protein
MLIMRRLVTVGLTVVVAGGLAAPAAAQPAYPPTPQPGQSVSDATPCLKQRVTHRAQGFKPGSRVRVRVVRHKRRSTLVRSLRLRAGAKGKVSNSLRFYRVARFSVAASGRLSGGQRITLTKSLRSHRCRRGPSGGSGSGGPAGGSGGDQSGGTGSGGTGTGEAGPGTGADGTGADTGAGTDAGTGTGTTDSGRTSDGRAVSEDLAGTGTDVAAFGYVAGGLLLLGGALLGVTRARRRRAEDR